MTPVSKSWFDTILYEVAHMSVVELLKILLFYVMLPVASLLVAYSLRKRACVSAFLDRFRTQIEYHTIRQQFNIFYNDANREELRDLYLRSALQYASSKRHDIKMAGILRLVQYSSEEAIEGLIRILSAETDKKYRKIMVFALYKMVKKSS